MHFYIGIATVAYKNNSYAVSAVVGDSAFEPKRLSNNILWIRNHTREALVVKNNNVGIGINAAANRAVEKLYIHKVIDPYNPPEITLVVPKGFVKNKYMFKHLPESNHWVQRASQYYLEYWLIIRNN